MYGEHKRMRRGIEGRNCPPGFGQILEEIRVNSEKIWAKQEKNLSENKKISAHTILQTHAHTHILSIEQK